jgi:hypothetical protein
MIISLFMDKAPLVCGRGGGMRERAHAPDADQPAACVRSGREGQHREHGEHENGVHLSASR